NRYEAALDKQSNEFYQTLYKEEILPSLKEEDQNDRLTSNQLEEIAHHLETKLVATEEQLQKEKKKEKQSQLKKKRRTYKKYLRKNQADY
ncbi:hypothetical protein KW813_22430, partial [Enterobacter quasiroggenkampii]|nr:hypothetical protein [Enterobacter quasiroggenkampii]